MPTITKQANRVVAVKPVSNGVLGRIAPVAASKIKRMKVSLYGNPKTGKTRLACTFPKPLLVIGSEDGTASVVGSKGVDFVQLERCEELTEVVKGPVSGGKYATVVIDNATKLRDMRITEILGLDEMPMQKGYGFAERSQWGECANSLKQLLRPLLDLPRVMDLNVVVIAQEGTIGGDEDQGSTGDFIKPAVGSYLGKSLCMWLTAECDYIGQTFIREGFRQVKSTVDSKEVTSRVPTGKKEFCLRVGPHEIYMTGFRQPLGRPEPPEVIVDPSYGKIVRIIQG